MGRLSSVAMATVLLFLGVVFSGCGSSSPTVNPRPVATVILSPAIDLSVDIGNTITFSASGTDRQGQALTNISFVSSNTSVVTISAGGLACAGQWDSLANPVICNPGTAGVAQITAVSRGVSSPPATIHVHQHIDSIVISPVTAPTTACFSKDTIFNYQVNAFSRGLDITSTVGNFTWQALNSSVVGLSTTASGLLSGQVQTTAKAPGITSIFASISGSTSVPLSFTTCPVQSISLALTDTGDDSFVVTSGAKSITPTVVDSLGTEITGVTLTWSSSNPAAITASGTTSVGSASGTAKTGSSTIIASCTPPACNAGFQPSLLIYPENVITGTVTGSGTPPTTSVWVTSSDCGSDDNCVTKLVPIDTGTNAVAAGVNLPFTPNSLVFDRQGSRAYLGTAKSLLNTKGLAVVTLGTGTAVTSITPVLNAPGKVLAVSPDGLTIIIANADDTNQVLVVTNPASAPPTITALPIIGATAADFSPDSFKAYIVAGSKLYVYSPQSALKTITLGGTASDVSFLPVGAFAYLAGGSGSSAVTVRTTCTDALAQTIPVSAVPAMLKAVPNNQQVLAVNPPGIDLVNVTTTPVGCPPTVSNTKTTVNLNQGIFVPKQLIVSADSSRAYLLTTNLTSVLIFDLNTQVTSAIPLSGNVFPVQASLTTSGKQLYVIGSDNTVHVLDTVNSVDTTQISFPDGLCHAKGSTTVIPCNPELIAVRP